MKKKLIFRILGALASALIIISMFVPFISVTGHSTSLWENYSLINSLYLPIMIIVFGAIGVIFFSLNIKTEFAYMSVGAVSFFIVIQTIDIIDQDAFNTLSIGYYFLIVGTILTAVMAFLTNLKSKPKDNKVEAAITQPEISILNQIDQLYDNKTNLSQNISDSSQTISNVIEPISLQPTASATQEVTPIVAEQTNSNITPTVTVQEQTNSSIPTVETQQLNSQPINPVIQEFTNPVIPQSMLQTGVVEQSEVVENTNIPMSTSTIPQPMLQTTSTLEQTAVSEPANESIQNPVIQEFMNPAAPVVSENNTNIGEVDIFGQPINK